MGVNYNDPPICPRCKNIMKRARLEVWGSLEKPNVWTCHQESCPIGTIALHEGETNTFERWLKEKNGK